MYACHLTSRRIKIYPSTKKEMEEYRMEEFKKFLNYAVLGFNKLREENKNDYSKMTAKKLIETIWLMSFVYDSDVAKQKADKILNSLELQQKEND